jgi:hypothetical protein
MLDGTALFGVELGEIGSRLAALIIPAHLVDKSAGA